MRDPVSSTDGFELDLTTCDREPIHILGNVQHHGCLIAVSTDWIVAHASANCADLLGIAAEDLLGRPFGDFAPETTIHDMRSRLQMLSHQSHAGAIYNYDVFDDERRYDISIHQSDRIIVLEFEPYTPPEEVRDDISVVQAMIGRLKRHDDIADMAHEAARGLRVLTGFDRVMVYRFEPDESGTVVAESRRPDMEPFLGLRYPASDIPKQARALYLRSPFRIISDVRSPVHPIVPTVGPEGFPLDLSLAVTRSVSPIHLEYLGNMGVEASMSVSIVRRGKLWGLFACHHLKPFHIDARRRDAIELFAQLFNYELANRESDRELVDLDHARQVHDRLMSQVSSGTNVIDAFEMFVEEIASVIQFDGAAIYSDGRYIAKGAAPTEDEFVGLARFLNTAQTAQIFATDCITARFPSAELYSDRVAGLLALPISRKPRDYLVLFRREVAASVRWAGNPDKPVEVGPHGVRLTPRKSFEVWKEIVRGKCTPWHDHEIRAADALRVTLLEVVLKLTNEANITRRRAQEQQELLIAELNHRVRNILNLIRGLISQSASGADTVEDYSEILDGRISALALAHDQLTHTSWSWVPLRALIETEVNAFANARADRIRLEGPELDLSPAGFTTVALVIHELLTNCTKYGALKHGSGSVSIIAALEEDGTATLSWREKGGPPVQNPTRKGFGTTIIERSIPYELKGSAEIRYAITGVEADFHIPSAHVKKGARPASKQALSVARGGATTRLRGDVLVVEDNMIISMDASDMVSELGAETVHCVANTKDAFAVLEQYAITFALLDINLGEETSLSVLEHCKANGIPVILATGYGDNAHISAIAKADTPIMKKPYEKDHLSVALSKL